MYSVPLIAVRIFWLTVCGSLMKIYYNKIKPTGVIALVGLNFWFSRVEMCK